jgi:choline dehydrogenase-like flavoprotein
MMDRKRLPPLAAHTLRKFTDAMFYGVDMQISSQQVVDNIQEQFAKFTSDKPQEIAIALTGLWTIGGGPLFSLRSNASRQRWLNTHLRGSKLNLVQDIARLRGVVYAGYYGHWIGTDQDDNRDNPVLRQLNFTLPKHRDNRPADHPQLEEILKNDLQNDAFIPEGAVPAEAEIIIIGSGAGGATAAAALAKKGHQVLILEAGSHYPTTQITHQEAHMTASVYVDGGLQTTKDNDIIVFQGRMVGGSTVINNGIFLGALKDGHLHPDAKDPFDTWNTLGAGLDRPMLEKAFYDIGAALGINPVQEFQGKNNGPHLLEGWRKLYTAAGNVRDARAPARWFVKNFGPVSRNEGCAYCGYCNTGCPYGRHNAMPQSFLGDAVANGAKILADATATEILWGSPDADGNRVASGVKVRLENGTSHIIAARRGVVVACGTMASSRLLSDSGVAESGSGISLNIASPVPALMPEGTSVKAWDEDQMATYVDQGEYLLESHFQPPMSMATLMPGWFAEHHRRMRNYNRTVSAGILFPVDRTGAMVGGKLSMKLGEAELSLARRALAKLCAVHFANGAVEVYPPLMTGDTLYPCSEAQALTFFEERIKQPDDMILSSSHPHGGNAINIDPDKGVVDPHLRVHGTTNLFVTDASVFPSNMRVNAQYSTMAISHYAMAMQTPFGR